MPPKTHSLIVPYAGPPFPLTLLTEQAFTRFTAFELRMDDVTVIRRVIFFENVLRSWVEGISRRGPDVDLLPIISRIPGPYLARITVAAINPEHFDAWLRQIPPTVRAACSGPVTKLEGTKLDVQTPFVGEVTQNPEPKKKNLAPKKRCRRVDGKVVRVGNYPSDAISPPSSDHDDAFSQATPSIKTTITPRVRSRTRAPNANMVTDELRAAIDYLETRLEVVESRSSKNKKKVNFVVDALKRNGTLPLDE